MLRQFVALHAAQTARMLECVSVGIGAVGAQRVAEFIWPDANQFP
jgi:hypothetical protein